MELKNEPFNCGENKFVFEKRVTFWTAAGTVNAVAASGFLLEICSLDSWQGGN